MATMETNSGGGDGVWEAGARAVRNNLVLARIAKHLPSEALVHLRTTCRGWNQALVHELRVKHPPIQLCNKPKTEIEALMSGHYGTGEDFMMNDYTELMRSSLVIPFDKYCIGDLTLARPQDFHTFFAICGPSIQALRIEEVGVTARNADRVWQIIFELAPQLTELGVVLEGVEGQAQQPIAREANVAAVASVRQLPKLRRLHFQSRGRGPLHPVWYDLLRDVIRSAPRLEHVHPALILVGGQRPIDHSPVLTALGELSPSLSLLKSLNLARVSVANLQILMELGSRRQQEALRLTEFDVSINCDQPDQDIAQTFALLHAFLTTQSTSLRALQLAVTAFVSGRVGMAPLRLPILNLLRIFDLNMQLLRRLPLQFDGPAGGTLANTFPNLERLTVDVLPRVLDEQQWANLAHPRVKELEWNAGLVAAAAGGETMVNLGHMYPAVKRFVFNLKKEELGVLSAIWGSWPELEALHMEYDTGEPPNLDEWLSGIPAAEFSYLWSDLRLAGPVSLGWLRTLQEEYKTKAGISDLAKLQRFTVSSLLLPDDIRVTDIGGYFGFALASRTVQHLVVERRNQIGHLIRGRDWCSEECRTLIREALGPLAVISV